jgi:hypothetical protein
MTVYILTGSPIWPMTHTPGQSYTPGSLAAVNWGWRYAVLEKGARVLPGQSLRPLPLLTGTSGDWARSRDDAPRNWLW